MDYLFAPERRVLANAGIVMRSYLPGDGGALQDAATSSYAHLDPWVPWANENQTVEDSERLVRQFRARYLLAADFVLGIFDKDEKTLLGGSGFHLRGARLDDREAEIGMWIRASHARRGLGTSVLIALLEWGFDEWPWERLGWRCDTRNTGSVRVAENAGMVREGTLRYQLAENGTDRRDTACFAALRSEWRKP